MPLKVKRGVLYTLSEATVLNIIAKNSLTANKNRKRVGFYCNSEVSWRV